ncbi:MAG: hypothetical protein ACAI25_15720, partial [Planctomycetota bacterium]
ASLAVGAAALLGYLPPAVAWVAAPGATVIGLVLTLHFANEVRRTRIQAKLRELARGPARADDLVALVRATEDASASDIEGVPELLDAVRRPGPARSAILDLLARMRHSPATDAALSADLDSWSEEDMPRLLQFFKKEPERAREVASRLLPRASAATRARILGELIDAAPVTPGGPWLTLFSAFADELRAARERAESYRRPKYERYLEALAVR